MRAALAFGALLAFTAPAAGTPAFDYISRFSLVQIFGELPGAPPPNNYYYTNYHTNGFEPFDESVEDEIFWEEISVASDASQVSNLAPTVFHGAGWSHMQLLSDDGTGTGIAWALSDFEVVFDLAQEAPVELTGWVHTPPGCGPPSGLVCEVRLWQWVGTSWVELYAETYENPVDYAAALAPGRYRLNAQSYIAGNTDYGDFPISGSTSFDITAQIVPEPATLALLMLTFLRSRRR
jgi:hypothetical protein